MTSKALVHDYLALLLWNCNHTAHHVQKHVCRKHAHLVVAQKQEEKEEEEEEREEEEGEEEEEEEERRRRGRVWCLNFIFTLVPPMPPGLTS